MGEGRVTTDIMRRALRRGSIILVVFLLLVGSWESRQRLGYEVVDAAVVTQRTVSGKYVGESREIGVRYSWQGSRFMVFIPLGILDALAGLNRLSEGDSIGVALNPEEPHQAIIDRLTQRYPVTLATAARTSKANSSNAAGAKPRRLIDPVLRYRVCLVAWCVGKHIRVYLV